MQHDPLNPLIVQGDRTILVEVDNPRYEQARDAIAPFSELVKSPEHIHTYRLTPLSLWNAAAAGLGADAMIEALRKHAKFAIPSNLVSKVVAELRALAMYPGDVHARAYADLQRAGIAPQLGRVGLDEWSRQLAGVKFELVAVATRSEKSAKLAQEKACMACHQIDKKEISFGTIGPSLWNYGKLRGVTDPADPAAAAIVKYTWGKLYNSKAYSACSNMPRFGHAELLNEQQTC